MSRARRSLAKRPVILTTLAVATLTAGPLAGCGSSGDSDKGSPGRLFTGTYTADVIDTLGQPPPKEPPKPRHFTWLVQSVCPGPGDGCVAVATSTAPDPKSNLNRDRMEFVYENGSWTRLYEPEIFPCTANATGKPANEPQLALHRTAFSADASSTPDKPVAKLQGKILFVLDATCSRIGEATISVNRIGDLPKDTPAPTDVKMPAPPVAKPPASVWHGTYVETGTPTATTGPKDLSTYKPYTTKFDASTLCTRDGAKCLVYGSIDGNREKPPHVYRFADGKYTSTGLASSSCSNPDVSSFRDIKVQMAAEPAGVDPADTVKGTRVDNFLGDCMNMTVTYDLAYKRIGD